jgi:hypothetical protein
VLPQLLPQTTRPVGPDGSPQEWRSTCLPERRKALVCSRQSGSRQVGIASIVERTASRGARLNVPLPTLKVKLLRRSAAGEQAIVIGISCPGPGSCSIRRFRHGSPRSQIQFSRTAARGRAALPNLCSHRGFFTRNLERRLHALVAQIRVVAPPLWLLGCADGSTSALGWTRSGDSVMALLLDNALTRSVLQSPHVADASQWSFSSKARQSVRHRQFSPT